MNDAHLDQVDAVTRTVAEQEVDGAPGKTATVTQTYDIPVADVWDAMTTAERIHRWLMPVTGDLRLGGRYQLEGNAGGTVLECEPPRRLRVTWEYAGDVSWVTAQLTEEDAGRTTVTIEHLARVDQERWAEFGPAAVGIGWDMMLLGLALHLRDDSLGTPEESLAWQTSQPGRDFMTASGEAWGAAQVASGDDEQAARAATDRTIAFYTGAVEEAPGPGSGA